MFDADVDLIYLKYDISDEEEIKLVRLFSTARFKDVVVLTLRNPKESIIKKNEEIKLAKLFEVLLVGKDLYNSKIKLLVKNLKWVRDIDESPWADEYDVDQNGKRNVRMSVKNAPGFTIRKGLLSNANKISLYTPNNKHFQFNDTDTIYFQYLLFRSW